MRVVVLKSLGQTAYVPEYPWDYLVVWLVLRGAVRAQGGIAGTVGAWLLPWDERVPVKCETCGQPMTARHRTLVDMIEGRPAGRASWDG